MGSPDASGLDRYAAGEGIFSRLPELETRRVSSVAANLGGGPDAHVVARGWLSAIHGMVIYWLDHPEGVSPERVVDVITAFLGGALASVSKQGVIPRHPVPPAT